MSKQEMDKLIENHEYDGIKEFDNPLPGWWLATFYITIIFAAFYYYRYEFAGAPNLNQELQTAMAEIEQAKQASPGSSGGVESEESLAAKMGSEASLKMGAEVYTGKCAACHGDKLQGIIGPNLTDKYWLHGKGTRQDILNIVKVGVTDKGMPAWELILKPEEQIAVTGFIFSKMGSNPEGAKAPQGNPVE